MVIIFLGVVCADEASSDCPAQEKNFTEVWEYASTAAKTQIGYKCLRLDLMIVASTKEVHHATFYPLTDFGSKSSFRRTTDGHLAENETFTSGDNNVFKLYGEGIDGTYTFQISNGPKILLTACATCVKPSEGDKQSSNCRYSPKVKHLGNL